MILSKFSTASDHINSYVIFSTKEQILKETKIIKKFANIDNLYFVSGGPRTYDERNSDSILNLYSPGFNRDNVIMDLLAAYEGGIHCLTAEIPEELF